MVGLGYAITLAVSIASVQAMQKEALSVKGHLSVPTKTKFAQAAQGRSQKQRSDPEYNDDGLEIGWAYVTLDEKEVAERGSVCIDGSTPGYFYKAGTEDDKWIISIEGGKMFCISKDECVEQMNTGYADPSSMVYLKLFESETFKNFNIVQLHHCDGGMFMSDVSEPVVHGGATMYFRGKRVVEHIFDTLKTNRTFSSATEVMITGGSGGGHATVVLADYFASLMPSTVKKLGAVPMSGWYTSDANEIENTFSLHEMSQAIAPGCREALSEAEQYKCLDPRVSYEYSTTPFFVVQMLDTQSLAGAFWDNDTVLEASKVAWTNCMSKTSGSCSSEERTILQDYLDGLVKGIQDGTKHSQNGEGGFISTCTKHVFYKVDEYTHYANGDQTVEAAVETWWTNLGTAGAKWFLPCDLNTNGAVQCEDSCAYDSGEDS